MLAGVGEREEEHRRLGRIVHVRRVADLDREDRPALQAQPGGVDARDVGVRRGGLLDGRRHLGVVVICAVSRREVERRDGERRQPLRAQPGQTVGIHDRDDGVLADGVECDSGLGQGGARRAIGRGQDHPIKRRRLRLIRRRWAMLHGGVRRPAERCSADEQGGQHQRCEGDDNGQSMHGTKHNRSLSLALT